MTTTFGKFLRQKRLTAGYGLRRFAQEIGWQPSNLSAVERGRKKPPRDESILANIASALGLDKDSEDWRTLFDLAARPGEPPADVSRYAAGQPVIPVLLRTLENRQLSEQELRELIEHINREY